MHARLDVKEDIPLPAGRLLIVSKKYNFDVTPDGRYGFTYNLAPSTAVTVTDLKARKSVGSIGIPGCGLIFAQAANRFSSLCADGSISTVTFDESAKASIKHAAQYLRRQERSGLRALGLGQEEPDAVSDHLSGRCRAGEPRRRIRPWPAPNGPSPPRPNARRLAAGRLAGESFPFRQTTLYRAHASKDALGRTRTSGSEVWEFDALKGKRLAADQAQGAGAIGGGVDAMPIP